MGHAYSHWPILFNAGGTGSVPGDYLFRDYSPSGNNEGQWGILRVQAPEEPVIQPEEPVIQPEEPTNGKGGGKGKKK
jgi:hypothetical protein